ncbi:hypothetical protein ACIPW5_13550 [Streptomyces sp. NPDC090077]|uniref:hypothetical protein n=1 Tax=Streptomyces sp. NPDC090077 TaxID=3365938 RepID=UPI0037FD2DE6
MAGESPDKSVDEGASGEQDPRLSVFQPRDPLKEAVAAWVATAGPDEQAEDAAPEPEAAAAPSRPSPGRVDPKTPKTPVASVVRQSAPRDEEEPAPAPADPAPEAGAPAAKPSGGAAPAKPSGDVEKPAAPAKPSVDVRTTAFGVVTTDPAPEAEKPRSASAGAGASAAKPSGDAEKPAAPAKPSADVRTTAFGVVTTDSADADTDAPAAKPSGGADKAAASDAPSGDAEKGRSASPDAEGKKTPSADVRTTAFGVVKPGSAAGADEPARDPRTAPADSERTAVFRTVKPATPPAAAADERTAVFRAVKPGSAPADADKPADKAEDKPADKPARDPRTAPAADERTAVFRTVKPGSASADAEKPGSDSERTTVFRAVKPAADGKDGKDGKKPATPPAESDNERTAAIRTVKPGSVSPAPDQRKPADKPAADVKQDSAGGAKGADRPGTAKADAPKPGTDRPAKPAAGESDRRVSTFVPLRGEGEPAAKPPVKPAPPAPPRPSLDPSERTTQQPLPPRPPLDMLADLTNNPPPPPTPMRNAIRRVKIYAPLVLLLIIVIAVVQLVRPLPAPKLKLTAKGTYTFPGGAPNLPWPTEGQASMAAAGLGTIGSSGEQKPVPIASVTKSMTAYIIMRDHPFKKGEKGAMIDVDKTAETEGQKDKSDNESTLNTVKEGEKISEYDAIAALMIPSANNIARLLARWDSGSQEAFVKKMNDTAKELGMTNTTYTDPSGLDATTVSTAEDQVKLGLKIVEIPALVDITRMPSWTDQTGKTWPNWNRLVPFNDSLGIKTGTTTKAGGNLLFAAQKKVGDTNQMLVGAVLGQHKPPIIDTVIAQSRSLLIATQKEVQGAPVVKKGQVVGYVDDGLGGHTPVVATADVQAVGWSSLTVDIKLGDGGTAIPESAKAGTQVGVLTVGDGVSQVKVPVALQRELVTPGFGSKLTRIG